jgi:hypothetical protein
MVKCVLSTNKYDHYGSPVKVLRNTRPVAMKGRPNTRRFPYPDGTGVTSSNYKKCDRAIGTSEGKNCGRGLDSNLSNELMTLSAINKSPSGIHLDWSCAVCT